MPRSTPAGHRRTVSTALVAVAVTTAGLLAGTALTSTGHAAPSAPRPVGTAGHHVGLHPSSGVTPAAIRAGLAAQAGARTKAASVLDPAAARLLPTGNGTVVVTVNGDARSVAAAAAGLGGRVLVAYAGQSQVQVAKTQLTRLAQSRGVTAVQAPVRGHVTAAGPSEGVAASNANAWQSAGDTGEGVDVAVVDLGFGLSANEYTTEKNAGHLGSGTTLTNVDCVNNGGSQTPYGSTSHGLATSEVVQQEAPDATLHLYCVNSLVGLASAETQIQNAGIKIVSMSVEWTLDSRGDGSGQTTSAGPSASLTVAKARKAGILWVNSAGNDVPQHYGGNFADVNRDGVLDMGNHDANTYPFESNFYYVSGTNSGANDAEFTLQWDEWPSGRASVSLQAYGVQCTTEFGGTPGPTNVDGCHGYWINAGQPISSTHTYGYQPTLDLDLAENSVANSSPYDQIWEVIVLIGSGTPAYRYDLNAFGSFDGGSALSCPTADANNNCIFSAAAIQRSVASPGNSPYAFTVGAANVGADGSTAGKLEGFSSQGPTIDNRIKPDITGWDGVSSYVPEFSGGFYGTSAAAPGVAGAAALVAGAQPTWDAAQIQNFLEQRAQHGTPINPPSNPTGHGLLTLGSPTDVALPTASKYQALPTPVQLIDNRSGLGGFKGYLAGGATQTVTLPTSVPAAATAVVIELAGTNTKGLTYLSAYAGGIAWPGTSNLNLTPQDATATVMSVVTIGSGRRITVRNNAAQTQAVVAVIGYFAPTASGGYVPVAPKLILDTRTTTGGHRGQIPVGGSARVAAGLPAGAVAAVVNVTSTNTRALGRLSATSDCDRSTGIVNYTVYTRADVAIVPLDANGRICVSVSGSPADVVVSEVGYMTASGGSAFYALPSSSIVVDTASGNGQIHAPVGAGATYAYQGAGLADVPYGATALLANVVGANASTSTYLTAVPGPRATNTTSTLNLTAGRTVSNTAFVGVDANGIYGVYNAHGTARAVMSVSGYFE